MGWSTVGASVPLVTDSVGAGVGSGGEDGDLLAQLAGGSLCCGEFDPGAVLASDRVVARGTGRYHASKRPVGA